MKSCLNKGFGAGGFTPEGIERVSNTLDTETARPSDAVETLLFMHRENTEGMSEQWKEIVHLYWDHMIPLLNTIMEITSMSLKIEKNFFEPSFKAPCCALKMAHYPAKESFGPNQLRYGEHRDYTGFTILKQEDIKGLQILFPNGEWVDCPTIEGAFTINTGDLIPVWTNDVFKSNIHRVVPNSDNSNSRLSVVFFTGPNNDTLVECIKTCCSDTNPPKYAPINAGTHLFNKLNLSNK